MKITHHKNGEIKTLVDEAPYHPGYEDAGFKPKAVNNKPVAWMDEETGCFVYSQYDYEDLDEHGKEGLIPLYTHPVELTDEEIKQVWNDNLAVMGNDLQFAKAILRKAQGND